MHACIHLRPAPHACMHAFISAGGGNISSIKAQDTLAERLRRRPAKSMGSPRVGSNPTGVVALSESRQSATTALILTGPVYRPTEREIAGSSPAKVISIIIGRAFQVMLLAALSPDARAASSKPARAGELCLARRATTRLPTIFSARATAIYGVGSRGNSRGGPSLHELRAEW